MAEPASSGVRVYRVGDLVSGLRGLLEERVGRVWIVGEISNLRRPPSGHTYFTLKDERGQIRAALFRSAGARLAFEPEDGLEVMAYADVTVYEPRGDLQVIVRQLEPRGDGALRLAFEQLRRRLEAEGLFERKRPLPAAPARIGVVASSTSAAWRDVLQVTGRRCPGIPIRLASSRVQGIGSEHEVAAALDALGTHGGVDVILLVRGGGSLEDLAAFNTEAVARAIARCPVPVISGVGHEIDVTIADLCADERAATPSAAAERATPDRGEIARLLGRDWGRLQRAIAAVVERASAQLLRERDAIGMLSPTAQLALRRSRLRELANALVREGARGSAQARLALGGLTQALPRAARATLTRERSRLAVLAPALPRVARIRANAGRAALGQAVARLEALSPLAVLGRGYALAQRAADGGIVRRLGDIAVGERLAVRVAEAEIEARVERVTARGES
jgi:exodeoxyribonuclease VII large subunit